MTWKSTAAAAPEGNPTLTSTCERNHLVLTSGETLGSAPFALGNDDAHCSQV